MMHPKSTRQKKVRGAWNKVIVRDFYYLKIHCYNDFKMQHPEIEHPKMIFPWDQKKDDGCKLTTGELIIINGVERLKITKARE